MSKSLAFFITLAIVLLLGGLTGSILGYLFGPVGMVIAIPVCFSIGFFGGNYAEKLLLNLGKK